MSQNAIQEQWLQGPMTYDCSLVHSCFDTDLNFDFQEAGKSCNTVLLWTVKVHNRLFLPMTLIMYLCTVGSSHTLVSC